MEISTLDARASGPTDAGPPDPAARADAPQLRTLLLTDLCDSTTLVERLGDAPAADLFREHDALVLRLQQQWRARLIDRSDGLLLLFERPIDGLGFALDYARGLREIGAARGHALQARAGLHVGEVLTWRNSEEAVRVGAKPLEVEGLAKPMAGRLMAMARPGQVLLSAIAEPLTRRAARELGPRGEQLAWKSHGRWRFKGVPQAQEIFEVGEPGLAPLRAPASSPKAWRDIPLWRRPAALAAQAAVLGAIAIGGWFALRPQPAIAFGERDWVVVADLRNLTGQPVLDESLEQAFRISLEQSRYVNVLSDLKARDTLARMRRPADTKLDRAIASEIALRDGARAVILPTVAEVGGRVRVSAEVVDPHTHTTVHVERADGRGLESALASIDEVTASLRTTLGEALSNVERDSDPLPDVATHSLEALRAYAKGHSAFALGKWDEALALYQRAVELDPDFALGHIAIARVHVALSDRPAALPALERALAIKQKLPERDRLYLDAWASELRDPASVLPRWKLLASLYPDFHAGQANTAWALYVLNDYQAARRYAERASAEQSPLRAHELDKLGRIHLALNKPREAANAFAQAEAAKPGVSLRRLANVDAIAGRHEHADARLDGAGSGRSSEDAIPFIDRVSFAVDRADWMRAEELLEQAKRASGDQTFLRREFDVISATVGMLRDPSLADRQQELVSRQVAAASVWDSPKAADDAFLALVLAYGAQRAERPAVATRVLDAAVGWSPRFKGTVFEAMHAVVVAGRLRASGKRAEAIALLEKDIDSGGLVQTRVLLMRLYQEDEQHEKALKLADWVLAHRGRAYVEANASQVLQALNVADTRLVRLHRAQVLAALDRHEESASELRRFFAAWPRDRIPAYLLDSVGPTFPDSKA